MHIRRPLRTSAKWLGAGVVLAAAGYAGYAGLAWLRYGHPATARADDRDDLLDDVMPVYDVADRHRVRIDAPAELALAVVSTTNLDDAAIVRAIFKAREWVLRAAPVETPQPRGLVAQVTAMGWRVLAERPGRELVFGAVTQPWLANVVFRGMPAAEFKAFDEPEYVKIVWNLRVEPLGPRACMLRTETRVATTDAEARRRFRTYWAKFSAGIVLIRRVMLAEAKREAERRARSAAL